MDEISGPFETHEMSAEVWLGFVLEAGQHGSRFDIINWISKNPYPILLMSHFTVY